jgi:deazaflavin-dependent oxidoreductase (nitroreductase family)
MMPRPSGLDHPLVPKFLRFYSQVNVWLYQRTRGHLGSTWRVGSAFPRGVPILLLTTVGRRSGQRRTTPLIYLRDGARVAIVGSMGGMPKHPQWYLNLRENADVEVQIGKTVQPMRARDATPDEHAILWPRLVQHYADFATYQSWTDRPIPVVLLEAADRL